MANLARFVQTGSLGPLNLGIDPFSVLTQLGDPEEESQKKNPLVLKYGSLQLVFWKRGSRSQLTDITLNFLPKYEPLPPPVAIDDFASNDQLTEEEFLDSIRRLDYLPTHLQEREKSQAMTFLSGVVVDFEDGLLSKARITQKESREADSPPLSDYRQPSQEQIIAMILESETALRIGAKRAGLLMAWAALEAALRHQAIIHGRRGRIGDQPNIMIRELLSAGVLSVGETRILEELRQVRNAAVHGLAPVEFPSRFVSDANGLTKRLIGAEAELQLNL